MGLLAREGRDTADAWTEKHRYRSVVEHKKASCRHDWPSFVLWICVIIWGRARGVNRPSETSTPPRVSYHTGLLVDYELTDKGELDRIVIANAARRRLEDDVRADAPDRLSAENLSRFYPVEGDCLVLRSSEFTTLNIKFLVLEPLNEASTEEGLAQGRH